VVGGERRGFLRQWRAEELLLLRGASRGRNEKEGAGDRTGEVTWEPEPASRPGGWRPAAVRPTPAYGRHVAGAGWSEARSRARERGEGGGRLGRSLGRKGSGVGPAAPAPFLFLNFFSPNSL